MGVYVCGSTDFHGGTGKYTIVKYYNNGILGWSVTPENGEAKSISVFKRRLATFGPVTYTVDIFCTGSKYYGTPNADAGQTVRYNKDGNMIWAQPKIVNDCFLNYLTLDPQENVYVTGLYHLTTLSQFTEITGSYDKNGNELWFWDYGFPNTDITVSSGIVVDANTNCYVTGFKDSLTSSQEYKTLKYGKLGNAKPKFNNESNNEPFQFMLNQNYPNPFNPSTEIKYSVPVNNLVTINVFNILGQNVSSIVNEYKNAGIYSVTFDGTNLATGVYFYTIEAGNYKDSKRMVLIK